MDSRNTFFAAIVAATLICVSSRAVNISNTWMLPEESFPVFYRYFRDRISWYEADAVCQFHHANLVTVDSTSEFDAVRAYLKELDITNNVWIGLSKNNDRAHFIWTDFRPLTNDGHWQEAIPIGSNPLCAATDPAADFRWHALPCGGPEVASFICELPVPTWATGSGGCLLTELPSLTVLYVPEQSALELTSDCGLDGTKRIACKGNADRDEMIKQLSCSISNDDFDDKTTKGAIPASTLADVTNPSDSLNTKTTKPWIWTSNTIDTGDYGAATRHRRETENTLSPISPTQGTTDLTMREKIRTTQETFTKSTTFQKPINLASNAVTVNTINDVTLDLSITPRSYKYAEITMTSVHELTTQENSSQPEEQAETFVLATTTAESKAKETPQEDTGEYPAVINQGQLFSIMENGTIIDVIELNETGTEETGTNKETSASVPQENKKFATSMLSTTSQPQIVKNLYTTVIYHKEPPEDLSIKKGAHETVKQSKQEVTPTFRIFESKSATNEKHKAKTINDLDSDDDKDLTKEVEMFHVIPDSSIKLNRTYRKKLPLIERNITKEIDNILIKPDEVLPVQQESAFSNTDDFIIADENSAHKVVEIKLHKEGNKNSTRSKLFITTRISDRNKRVDKDDHKINTTESERTDNSSQVKFDEVLNTTNIETEMKDIEIDSRINDFNVINITTKFNNSEFVLPIAAVEKQAEDDLDKKQIVQEEIANNTVDDLMVEESQEIFSTISSVTGEPAPPIPQQQPRPNRQRSLTKPQRRSFYPYFFSRVLG
ncbi:hypothetical protein RI129_004977 [Pyrocoelia pectoralis]|uniref:C-type lectin domain-containing protein n=1 Tax=Pyrocoelia pectoralis TaxID=417401 RepID=A0AAN7VIR0_9COLE